MKIVDYKIMQIREVKDLLQEGWQPYGPPTFNEYGTAAEQAMVRYENDEPQIGHHRLQVMKELNIDLGGKSVSPADIFEQKVQTRLKHYEQFWNADEKEYRIPDPNHLPDIWTPTREALEDDIRRSIKFEEEVR